MPKIDWSEYKEFKNYSVKEDKLIILVDFMKSYYNITNAFDIFDYCKEDDIALMLLEKRGISDAEALENYIFKHTK
jgi:hypothetical protein